MNTTENNILIAEFMGGKYDKDTTFLIHPDDIWLPIHGVCSTKNNGKTLNYNSSWDWLMPVVEKIESLEDENGRIAYLTIHGNYCEILLKDCVLECDGETKIEAVYNAVIEFIKWHNENNH